MPTKWVCGRTVATCTTDPPPESPIANAAVAVEVDNNLECSYDENIDLAENCYIDEQHWDPREHPSSPEDAFKETCQFYGSSFLAREWLGSANEFPDSQELKILPSRGRSVAHDPCKMTRSKSLHVLERASSPISRISRRKRASFGLSEDDLNRARSVLGLPTTRRVSVGSSGLFYPYESSQDLGYSSRSTSQGDRLNVR